MFGMRALSVASMAAIAMTALATETAWAQSSPPDQPPPSGQSPAPDQSPPPATAAPADAAPNEAAPAAAAGQAAAPKEAAPGESAKAPSSLVVYFALGSATIDDEGKAKLDQAGRLYRDGQPILMTLTGAADKTGKPTPNLLLSQRRANAVFDGLVARGIPPGRFEVVAKGETEPVVPTADGVAERRNRQVEITWR